MASIVSVILMFCFMIVLNTIQFLQIGGPVLSVTIKTITSVFFVAAGFFAAKDRNKWSTYTKLIFAGLVFGFLGDFLLGLDFLGTIWFITGVVAFAVGHIFYIVAFSKVLPLRWYNFLPGALFLPFFLFLVIVVGMFDFNGLFPAVIIYSLILAFMLGKSIGFASYLKGKDKVFGKYTLFGAILFAISDFILLFIFFAIAVKNNSLLSRILSIMCLLTYYSGQGLIALSLKEEPEEL